MYGFEHELFVSGLHRAVGLKQQIEGVVDEICTKGFDNLFLIGAGGTIALQYPLEYILKSHSTLSVHAHVAAEFVLMGHKHFTDKSLVLVVSDSGTTKETVEAALYAKQIGAKTVSFVSELGTPLANIADYAFANQSEGKYESFLVQLYIFVFRLMYNRNEFSSYEQFMSELKSLPHALVKVKESTDAKAEAFAKRYKDEDYHMLIGSGNLWGETYLYAMCILEEMQRIRTKAVHAAEFFHGSLELIDENTSVILFKGEDETRPLVERVERFTKQHTDKLTIFDTKDFELDGISEEFRPYLPPIVMVSAMERVSKYLERERNHPLSTRRYYRVVSY